MAHRHVTVTGRDALDLGIALLRRIRLAEDTAASLEAADLCWWWRRPRESDHVDQHFWVDAGDEPVAAAIFTDWPHTWAGDLVVMPGSEADLLPEAWSAVAGFVTTLTERTCQVAVAEDDRLLSELVAGSGLVPTDHVGVEMWMDAGERQPTTAAPPGYGVLDRAGSGGGAHHMIPRNGPEVAERLADTPLYRADLDLYVVDPDGDVAAYGLFWFDPVTGVGLVEPMRTEDEHQGRGLARVVLTAGLDRLARLGARRLKIVHDADNPVAAHLYESAGFHPTSTYRMHTTTLG